MRFYFVALIGIHITKPFQALLIDYDTKYSTLAVAFPKLYEELTTVNAADLCTTSTQAYTFISKEIFLTCAPDKAVLDSIDECTKSYGNQIVPLMKLMISKIADFFDVQRGAIFGFGTHADDDTGPLLKVADATAAEMTELDRTTVHNLAEERSVGSISNGLKIRGKRNLESASRKLVLNKSFDLIEKRKLGEYLNYRKPGQAISDLKKEWHEKMKLLENEAFADKDHANMHLDSVKYNDLEFLKSCGGPFTSAEEVEEYVPQIYIQNMNKRLFIEVRYAKNTSLRLKHSDPVFRLRRNGKNLSNEEFAKNLVSYLGSARKTTTISPVDLENAISKITGSKFSQMLPENLSNRFNESDFPEETLVKPGEHIAVFWIEKANNIVWYLGIVDDVKEETVMLMHLKHTDKNGYNWVILVNPEVLEIEEEQILLRNISVMYYGVSCRIELSKKTVNDIMGQIDVKQL